MTIEMEYADIWQQFNIDYTHLRGQFLLISKPHLRAEDLNELKSYYTNVINSVRVYDYITSVEQLLRILEKRNVLAYDKIEPLKYISYKYIRDPELERLLRDYECKIVGRSALPLYNVYTLRDGKYMTDQTTRRKSRELIDNIILENDNDNNVYPHNRFTHARGNISSFEDHIIPETATFLPNNVLPLIAERGNDRIFFLKIRDRFRCKNCLGVLAALFGTSLLIAIILMCNKLSVKSSAIAPQPEDQPSTSGIQKRVNATQVYGQLTLHTTQPAFHLTIPASVYVGVPSAVDETAVIRTVLLKVSEKLGRNWRDVARFLDVTEYEIDEIESKFQVSIKEKAFKALQIFQSKCDATQWKSKLKRALDNARRRDLMEFVDKIS